MSGRTIERETDILIVGGGTGGTAAAMAAASLGARVLMTEETDWIGGQLTSQAVPTDDHRWIETHGCTRRYRGFREGVRAYYRAHVPLSAEALANPALSPGGSPGRRLSFDFRIGVAVLEQQLAQARLGGLVEVRLRTRVVGAETDGDRVRAVRLRHVDTGDETIVSARYFLDATELGDVLPLAGVEYVSGAESQAETGEPHAVEGPAQPDNVQAITWCFPMAHDDADGADHTIEKPAQYERWRDYVPDVQPAWPGRLLDWTDAHPHTLLPRHSVLFPEEMQASDAVRETQGRSFWLYRRVVCRDHHPPGTVPHDVTLVNWPMNDYWELNIIDKPEEHVRRALEEARQLSLSLLYWLQTEAPRAGGGSGYPGLYLRPDMVGKSIGASDGLAKYPYIRESRRIRAVFTVTENHVGAQARGVKRDKGGEAEPFRDSVGVGSYRIDLHPSTGGNNYIDIESLPFRIPLGALLPVRLRNLLPACKNLGVTHITNGCYRLHPVEWNIGEAAGLLAAHCLARGLELHQVREDARRLEEFQALCVQQGFELEWPRVPARVG